MDRDTIIGIIVGALFLATFAGYGIWRSNRLEDIADCMAEKGDMHSRTYYDECVKELG